MDPRYRPNSVPNFVHYSNYPLKKNKSELTREDIIVEISTRYDLPIEDIYVEEFIPNDLKYDTSVRWAAFIRNTHRDIVINMMNNIARMLSPNEG